MAHELTTEHPKAKNGLTPPLSKSLGSQELAKHRAMVAVELEALAKKLDRFGWDRDRGTMAHDRMMTDWMDALHDYPLEEIKTACRDAVLANPNKMPNEGHILGLILSNRAKALARLPKQIEPEPETSERPRFDSDELIRMAGIKGMSK